MTHGTITGYTNAKVGPRTVDVRPTLRYLELLLAAGHTHTTVAAAAGVRRSTIGRIAQGHRRRIQQVTADAIMGVTLDEIAEGHKVPVARARQIVKLMREAGVSQRELCRVAGITHCCLPTRGRVSWETWRRLCVVARMAIRQGILAPDVIDYLS